MKKRNIGGSGLAVSPVGLGCMGFSHAFGAPTEKSEAVKILRQAFDMGYTMFDTAECYTGVNADGTISYNEELVGEALRAKRDQVVIATKCGVSHAPDHSLILDSRPETIRKSVEGSLRRLGTDYIDLYYQHRIDPKVEPEEVAQTMGQLIKEGKIRSWGISEATEDYLRRAHAVCPVAAIQNRYSMMARMHESIFPTVQELGVSYVAFSPLANGVLSGRYDENSKFDAKTDYRSSMPQYSKEGMAKSRRLMDYLQKLAAEKNATSAQISLAWMLGKGDWLIPIPGSRKPERLRENFMAAEVAMSPAEIQTLDEMLDDMDFLVFGGSPINK